MKHLMSSISVPDTTHQCVSQYMTYMSVGVGQHVDQHEEILIDQIHFSTPRAIGLGPVFNDKSPLTICMLYSKAKSNRSKSYC